MHCGLAKLLEDELRQTGNCGGDFADDIIPRDFASVAKHFLSGFRNM
jgi:hypothetical protein